MRRVLAVFVLVFLITGCGLNIRRKHFGEYPKPIFIHEDVGEKIDATERHIYGLFPDVDGFLQATFFERPSGGYHWTISTDNGEFTAFNNDPQAVLILADYIDRHEEILESRAEFETDWSIVDYDSLGQPITQKEVDLVITQLKKRKGRGMAGCALGGCLSGAALGASSTLETHSLGYGSGCFAMEVSKEAVIIGTLLGSVVGLGTGALILRTDAQQAIKFIKQVRKPRAVD